MTATGDAGWDGHPRKKAERRENSYSAMAGALSRDLIAKGGAGDKKKKKRRRAQDGERVTHARDVKSNRKENIAVRIRREEVAAAHATGSAHSSRDKATMGSPEGAPVANARAAGSPGIVCASHWYSSRCGSGCTCGIVRRRCSSVLAFTRVVESWLLLLLLLRLLSCPWAPAMKISVVSTVIYNLNDDDDDNNKNNNNNNNNNYYYYYYYYYNNFIILILHRFLVDWRRMATCCNLLCIT